TFLVYCSDNALVEKEVSEFKKNLLQTKPALELFSWGKAAGNDLQITSIAKKANTTIITGIYNRETHSIQIPFADEASIENAITCWAVLILLKKDDKEVVQKFASLYPISMRLELKHGLNNCTIINDSYSNDLYSLSIGLNFLIHQKQHKKYTVILSDVLQSGRNSEVLYSEVASLLIQKKVDQFIGIGPEIFASKKLFSSIKSCHFYHSVGEFLKDLATLQFHDQNILVKGARSFGFEQIVSVLEQKVHQTILSIDLKAIVHNLKYYKQLLPSSTKLMAMVKAFSYGSGSHEIASVLEYHSIDYLAVAYTDEGVELRKAGISIPIMVMNVETTAFASLINYMLEPEIFSFSMLRDFENFLKSNGVMNYPVHLKIDTGMHRLGFTKEDLPELISILSGSIPFAIKSVFTHLVASEDAKQDVFTKYQIKVFKECTTSIKSALKYDFYSHVANTSAISRHRNAGMDMARLGIGLYGIDHNSRVQKKLCNVTTLTTTISQIKNVKAGDTVGYGRNAKLHRESIIATVRIGYADGYPRSLGNGMGKMLVQDKLVPVVGNVCMDMTMLDITDLHGVHEGDSVIVFGEKLPLPILAKWANTIPYEIMTGISQRVKRVYFEE
ncbi:MAG: alanine racemase, partial [Ginsengibacter sp.]